MWDEVLIQLILISIYLIQLLHLNHYFFQCFTFSLHKITSVTFVSSHKNWFWGKSWLTQTYGSFENKKKINRSRQRIFMCVHITSKLPKICWLSLGHPEKLINGNRGIHTQNSLWNLNIIEKLPHTLNHFKLY